MTALTDGAIIKITLWVNGRSWRWATVREGLRRKKDKIKLVSHKLMHSATLRSFIIILGESFLFLFCRNPKKIYTIQISCYSEKDSVDFHSSSMTSLAYIDCIAAARSSYCTVAFVAIGIVLSLPGPPPPSPPCPPLSLFGFPIITSNCHCPSIFYCPTVI